MKAWQFTGTGNPPALNEVDEPHAGPGEVVVDVKAAGVCHSDVATIDDDGMMALYPELPRTMGHESAGVISEVGAGMGHWKIGDRVGLSPLMPDGDALGAGRWDGGFAAKIRATDFNLVKLPDEVPFDLGAMATDAGLTAYHAMMAVGGATKGTKVGVIGLGGLGYIGARCAVLAGAEVYGVDISPETQKLADEIGLAGVADSIDAFRNKNLNLIVDYAGFGTTTAAAVETLAEFGTLVQVGLGRLESTINTFPLISKQLSIKGSWSGTKEDLAGIYELMKSGELNPPINHITHDGIPDAISKLRKGGVIGRFIAMYE
ncbi:zinc-binding dehydrogenase [Rhodococcus sp. T2V]|uniref:zinc-binding dehydrogenase n=1 Tax=Rhodococcus sp. T2V TaxID=3034164 RepID=UPI0023E09032|nr:zinc-binding dehydrogenase [Rhodococcus sp. T2V]MDF3312201.1 zinc-binding dehydrogenase [Rhodococcus sp. T2V]